MACRIEGKRETSPISNAQVSAVIGPTPGNGPEPFDSLCQQRISLEGTDQGVFRFLQSHNAVLGSLVAEAECSHSPLRCLQAAHGNSPLCVAVACCDSLLSP